MGLVMIVLAVPAFLVNTLASSCPQILKTVLPCIPSAALARPLPEFVGVTIHPEPKELLFTGNFFRNHLPYQMGHKLLDAPPAPRTTTPLPHQQRLAAAIIFQAFKDAARGPQCRREEAPERLHSDTAGRKAYQTRFKRGNWMKPTKKQRPNQIPPAGVLGSRGAISTGHMEIAAELVESPAGCHGSRPGRWAGTPAVGGRCGGRDGSCVIDGRNPRTMPGGPNGTAAGR